MRADARKNRDQLLSAAKEVVTEQGADASLRDVARRAGVGLGTLYRHFPKREALLEALLRASFEELAARAGELGTSDGSDEALLQWLREVVSVAHGYSGVIALMIAAIDDPDSALHASCVDMKAAGTRLLIRAQTVGSARTDIDGADLFALVGALGWIADQPPLASRFDNLFRVVSDGILGSAK